MAPKIMVTGRNFYCISAGVLLAFVVFFLKCLEDAIQAIAIIEATEPGSRAPCDFALRVEIGKELIRTASRICHSLPDGWISASMSYDHWLVMRVSWLLAVFVSIGSAGALHGIGLILVRHFLSPRISP